MLPPVLEIHLLWHPADEAKAQPVARRIAAHFQGAAFASLLAGAVDVQVHSIGWRNDHDTPRPILWPDSALAADQPRPAQHVAVVPLVACGLNRALMPHDGSPAWRRLIDDIGQRAGTSTVGVLPICLDREGLTEDWPANLRKTQPGGALDALLHVDDMAPGELDARRLLDLVQHLARWLSGPGPGDQAGRSRPLQVFISHTKRLGHPDEQVAPLVDLVRQALSHGSRLHAFYDAHDLQPGEDWDRALREQAATSAVLALRTDRYASREWCQREVLTAKQHGMPVVMLDALTQGEERGSFLLDHVPRLPVRRRADGTWDDNSVRQAIRMLADAWLHRALWQRQHGLVRTSGSPYARYGWLEQAPEPSTLDRTLDRWPTPAAETLRLLHPDPPMAAPEHEVLAMLARRCGIGTLDITTPRLLAARGADLHDTTTDGTAPALLPREGLRGRRIGLSTSDSEDLARLGLLHSHQEQAVRELARIVFVSGGTLAYGGNLDRDKFSWVLIDELRRYASRDCGRLALWLSWHEHRRRPVATLDEARDAMGRFGDLRAIDHDGQLLDDPCANRDAAACPLDEDDEQKARRLTDLRRHLTDNGHARLLIGGKRAPYTGRMPGLLEEVLMSLRQQQPVYLAGGFGGITLHIAAQIDPDACTALLPPAATLDQATQEALVDVRGLVGTQGWSALRNGLDTAQNRHLAVTHRPAEIAVLVGLGLGRLPALATDGSGTA